MTDPSGSDALTELQRFMAYTYLPQASNQYDDEVQLFRIAMDHYAHLTTGFEQRTWHSFEQEGLTHERSAKIFYQQERQALRDNFRHEDPLVLAGAASGAELFCRAVAKRIAREHARDLNLNRCPMCNRIPQTPVARQCLWCHHDWH